MACLNDRSKALFPGNALAVLRDEITHAGTRQGRAAPQRVGRGLLHAWLTCSRHSIRHLPMIMRAELKPSGTSCAPLSFPSRWAMRSAPSPQASLRPSCSLAQHAAGILPLCPKEYTIPEGIRSGCLGCTGFANNKAVSPSALTATVRSYGSLRCRW